MVGGMGVRKNQYIEEWASRRENCEHAFRYTRGVWTRLAIFGIAVPLGLYHMICTEMLDPNSNAMRDGPKQLGYNYKFLGGYKDQEAKSSEDDSAKDE